MDTNVVSDNSSIKKGIRDRNTDGHITKNANNTLREENPIKLTSIDAVTNEQSQQSAAQTGMVDVDKINKSTLSQMQF